MISLQNNEEEEVGGIILRQFSFLFFSFFKILVPFWYSAEYRHGSGSHSISECWINAEEFLFVRGMWDVEEIASADIR